MRTALNSPQTFASALRQSARCWRQQLLFALVWATATAICVTVHFLRNGWSPNEALWKISVLYFCGSFIGGYVALLLSQPFAVNRTSTARFATFFVALSVFTLGFTLLLFLVQHRLYFSQWHSDVGTITWFYQLFYTGLGSILLFLLTGLRPLLPCGMVLLFVASLCFSRGWFSPSR